MTRKKTLFVLLLFVTAFILATGAASANSGIESTPYTIYSNARFGYQIVYPDIFDVKTPSDNGDGQTFVHSGMSTYCTLKVWGSHNIDKKNGYRMLEDAKNHIAYIAFDEAGAEHYNIIYSDQGGKDGRETVFYEYGIASESTTAVFLFTFPYELKDYYIPLIQRTKVTFTQNPSWLTLIDAIAYSQSMHLDAFKKDSQPDAVTLNNTLYYLVQKNCFYDKYRGKNLYDDKYSFAYGPEDADGGNDFDKDMYTSPDKLYDLFFAKGSYQYPAADFSKIKGTQTGILVSMEQPVNKVKVKILKEHEKNNIKTVDIDISQFNSALKKAKHIGQARVTLQKDDTAYFGYTLLSFEPKYKQL